MTGGVEFEAMSYFVSLIYFGAASSIWTDSTLMTLQTTQLKLVNAIAKCVEALKMPKEHEHSAYIGDSTPTFSSLF